MKSERDFRNYLAGAALAFGVVLLTSQIMALVFGGTNLEEGSELYNLLLNIYLLAHVVGGILGGYLVARVRRSDFIQTGTVTAILAYIFEFAYNVLVEHVFTDIYAVISLLIGSIVGAMLYRARTEKSRIVSKKTEDKPKTEAEKY